MNKLRDVIAEAIQEIAAVDLSQAEAQFADSIPKTPAAESMVRETSLEYRRMQVLRALGVNEGPEPDSLLSRFLSFAPRLSIKPRKSEVRKYEDLFDHKPNYPWTTEIDSLCFASGKQPAVG